MKKNLCMILLFFSLLNSIVVAQTQMDPFDQINEEAFVIVLDDSVRSVCRAIIDRWHQAGYYCTDEDVQAVLNWDNEEMAYETVINALQCLIELKHLCGDPTPTALLQRAHNIHDALQQEYAQLCDQMNTRRKKCKTFCKVITQNLCVNCLAQLKKVTIRDSLCVNCHAKIGKTLTVNDLNGVVMATDGLFSAGLIQTANITDGAVTNSKLADNSVSNQHIAPMSILPEKLAFNGLDTFSEEPNLLRVTRGTVNADGSILNGAGFAAVRTGVGLYTITFSTNHTSTNSYQVLANPTTSFNRNINITPVSATQFQVSIVDNANAAVDEQFHFLTIGAIT